MANKIYIVELSSEERARLGGMLSNSKSSSRASLKARILLKADQGAEGDSWTDSRICEALETNSAMVERVRQKCVTEGVDAVFRRKPRATPPTARIFDGEAEAKLITLACSEPPEGYARWSIYDALMCANGLPLGHYDQPFWINMQADAPVGKTCGHAVATAFEGDQTCWRHTLTVFHKAVKGRW